MKITVKERPLRAAISVPAALAALTTLVAVQALIEPLFSASFIGQATANALAISAVLPWLLLFIRADRSVVARSADQSRRRDGRTLLAVPLFAITLVGALLAVSTVGAANVQLRLEPLSVTSGLTAVVAFVGQVAAEELIFRIILPLGLALAFTSTRDSLFWGVVLANVAFAWWHLPASLPAFIDHFAFGLLMALLYARTKSLLILITVHLMNNLFVVLVDAPVTGSPELVTFLIVLKFAVLFSAASILFRPSLKEPPDQPATFPHSSSERYYSLDILRGIALIAIVLENSLFYSIPEWTTANPSGEDRLTRAVLALLVEYRGLPIFCLLLGFTAHLMLTRYGASGQQVKARAKLFIILGAIHGLFVFPGDILAVFGIALLVVLWFNGRTPATRRVFVWIMGGSFVLQAAVAGWGSAQTSTFAEISAGMPGFLESSLARAVEWSAYVLTVPFHVSAVLFPILLGFTTWKKLTAASRPSWRIATVTVGLLLTSVLLCLPNAVLLASDWGQSRSGLFTFLGQLGGLAGALGAWIAAVRITDTAFLQKSALLEPVFRGLEVLGRRTLSLYLGSSVIYFVALSPSGLNLLAHLPLWSVWATVLLGLVIYVSVIDRGPSSSGWAERAQQEFCRPRTSIPRVTEWNQTSGDSRGDWIAMQTSI